MTPTPAQRRYMDLEEEIVARTFALAGDAIAEDFVRAANEVINREREERA